MRVDGLSEMRSNIRSRWKGTEVLNAYFYEVLYINYLLLPPKQPLKLGIWEKWKPNRLPRVSQLLSQESPI